MATYTEKVLHEDTSGLTLLASLATLDAGKSPEYAPHDPDADQAYLDQAMDSRGTLDNGDTLYQAEITVPDNFSGWVIFHTTAISTNPDFSGVTLKKVHPYKDSRVRPARGVAFEVVFPMVQSSDHATAATGLTPTIEVSKDGGAFAAATNSPSEISDGFYKVTLTTTEMTADAVVIKATAATADARFQTIYVNP